VGAVTITTLQMVSHNSRLENVALVAANAHVGWERDPKWMEVMILELRETVDKMRQKGFVVGCVACGDFNGLFPAELGMLHDASMRSAYAYATAAMASGGPVTTCHNDQYHGGRIPHPGDSDHDVKEGCEGGETDHIVFSDTTLTPTSVLQIPLHERLIPVKPATGVHPSRSLPCPEYPSDHVAIMTEFKWLRKPNAGENKL